jgi:hypothetical protein
LQSSAEGDGEQKPPGPQSESMAQWLPAKQIFAAVSDDEERQSHGVAGGQSESLKHWS